MTYIFSLVVLISHSLTLPFLLEISLCFSEMFSVDALEPKLKCYFYAFASFWREPLQASCDGLLKCHKDLLMLGDIDISIVAAFNHQRQALFSGKGLETIDEECRAVTAKMVRNESELESLI